MPSDAKPTVTPTQTSQSTTTVIVAVLGLTLAAKRKPMASRTSVQMVKTSILERSARTATFAGTLEWRFRFLPHGPDTRVVESYLVTKQVSAVGWFMLSVLKGSRDRRGEMRASMATTLARLAELAELAGASATSADED